MAALTEGTTGFTGERIGIWYKKTKDGDPHDLVPGTKYGSKGIVAGAMTWPGAWNGRANAEKNKTIRQFSASDWKDGAMYAKLLESNNNKYIIYIDAKGDEIGPLSKFQKTSEYKGDKKDFNKGNVAEYIFAAAIFARFVSREKRVDESDVKRLVFNHKMTSNTGNYMEEASNKGVKVMDEVYLHWGLAQNNWDALQDDKLWTTWTMTIGGNNIMSSALDYANSPNVTKWAQEFYTNRMMNKIHVWCMGETDQKGTKVDIQVTATDHDGKEVPVDIKVSLKYGAVGQFGQFGGTSYEVQEKVWDASFGLKPALTKSEYEGYFITVDHITDTAKAMYKSYEAILPKIKELFEDPDTNQAAITKFANFLKQQVTLGEKDVMLVAAKAGQAVHYDIENVKTVLKVLEFEFELDKSQAQTEGEQDLPILKVYAKTRGEQVSKGDLLIDMRVKRGEKAGDGTPYYRNIFEKKAKFTDLFAETYNTVEFNQ